MLNKFFSKPVELKVRDETLSFRSVADFEFGMAGRTAVPSAKLSALFKLSVEELRSEEQAIQKTEAQMLSVLANSIDDPDSIEEAMRKLDSRRFSQEHGWRDIIKGLNEGDEVLNPLRRVALAKYLQYLTSLREAVGYVRSEKERHFGAAAPEERGVRQDFKATVLPERGAPEAVPPPEEAFERLPKGKAVAIRLLRGNRLDVLLSTHKCQLMAIDDHIQFVDQDGRKSILRKGHNLVGRGGDSTVQIEPSLRDVSRVHLLIDNQGDGKLFLTDLSAAGTFVAT